MSVYSMTGYAAVQSNTRSSDANNESGQASTARLGVEIRSVNSRFLDLSFRLPDELRQELASPFIIHFAASGLFGGHRQVMASPSYLTKRG